MRLCLRVSVSMCVTVVFMLDHVLANSCLQECLLEASKLEKAVPSTGDIRLYTPLGQHAELCPQKAMRCFASELKVLIFEYDGVWRENVTESAAHVINCLMYYRSHVGMRRCSPVRLSLADGCLMCEQFDEEPASHFLSHLNTFLMFIIRCHQVCPAEGWPHTQALGAREGASES